MINNNLKPLLSGRTNAPLCLASVGECMMELAPVETVDQYKKSFAGDAVNALWYAKQLNPTWNTRFVSRVGQDMASDEMVNMLTTAGIDTQHVQRCTVRTVGLYMISLKDGERSFSYWRGQSAAKQLADNPTLIDTALQDADVVLFSGITVAILQPEARAKLMISLAAARAAGKTVVFDPNLRPRLWKDLPEMCEAIMQSAEVSDIVLPSFDEEAVYFGDADPQATSTRYLKAGAKTVVVKNGPDAVYFVHDGVVGETCPTPATDVVDTTSAGDSFNAGLLSGMAQFSSMEDAIALACNVSRQVIAQRGALVQLDIDILKNKRTT